MHVLFQEALLDCPGSSDFSIWMLFFLLSFRSLESRSKFPTPPARPRADMFPLSPARTRSEGPTAGVQPELPQKKRKRPTSHPCP